MISPPSRSSSEADILPWRSVSTQLLLSGQSLKSFPNPSHYQLKQPQLKSVGATTTSCSVAGPLLQSRLPSNHPNHHRRRHTSETGLVSLSLSLSITLPDLPRNILTIDLHSQPLPRTETRRLYPTSVGTDPMSSLSRTLTLPAHRRLDQDHPNRLPPPQPDATTTVAPNQPISQAPHQAEPLSPLRHRCWAVLLYLNHRCLSTRPLP